MNANRIEDQDGSGATFAPGDVGRIGGTWFGMTPTGILVNLANYIEDDGTLNASIPIDVDINLGPSWHGTLENDVWTEAS